MMTEIAKFTFPKILKTGDIIESEPCGCQRLNIIGLSVYPEQFLYKDLKKLLQRTLFHFLTDGKTFLKLPLFTIPSYPYPFMDYVSGGGAFPFYDLRIPKANILLSLSANEVVCKLEVVDHVKHHDGSVFEVIDTSPLELDGNSILSVHLTDSLEKKINIYTEYSS